jgi:hypothetical protein
MIPSAVPKELAVAASATVREPRGTTGARSEGEITAFRGPRRRLGSSWQAVRASVLPACFFACIFAGFLACGTPAREAAHPGGKTTSLRLRGTPDQASVVLDDQFLGNLAFVASHGVALPRGKHRLTVEAQGYFPFDREITGDEGPVSLEVQLRAIPQ